MLPISLLSITFWDRTATTNRDGVATVPGATGSFCSLWPGSVFATWVSGPRRWSVDGSRGIARVCARRLHWPCAAPATLPRPSRDPPATTVSRNFLPLAFRGTWLKSGGRWGPRPRAIPAQRRGVLPQRVALRCSALQRVAARCSVLQRVAAHLHNVTRA